MRKTIAFHIPSLVGGGAERVICNLANHFAEEGYRVSMITSEMEDHQYYQLDEHVTRVVLPKPTGNRILKIFRRLGILRKAIRDSEAPVVVSFIGMANLRAILATRFMKTKVIVSVRSAPGREYKGKEKLAKFLFRFAEGAVFQTGMAREYFPGTVRRKSTILMNPLLGDFSRARYEGQREKEIVTVGRLHPVKNHEMLLRAFARFHQDDPDYVLRIYGDGENRTKLEELIQELACGESVFLEGNCDAVADAIWKASLFVLTSNTEGMPNALLEAMALGLPCISTDCPCGGPAALIRDGENGLLIPVGDEDALVDAMERILSEKDFAEKLGRSAEQAKEQYAPEKIYQMWEDYITEVADR